MGNLDSTNGCAVIAPLVCQMHIGEKKELTNSDVARVIDDIVPPILAHIRKKHGLGNCAFIIKEHVIAVLRVGKEYHFVDSLGGGDASGMGTRTVCADVEALRVFLRYYVSKKLPPN